MRCERLVGRVLDMGDLPAQAGDRDLAVHLLEAVEDHRGRVVGGGVLVHRHALLGRPSGGGAELLLVLVGRIEDQADRAAVIHALGERLADAAEAQHVVAEPLRRELGEVLEVLQLLAARIGLEMERDAHRHLVPAPQRLHRAIVHRIHAAAGDVVDAGHAEPVELAEIAPRALDLVREGRPGDLVGEEVEGAVVAGDHAGEVAGRVLLGLAARDLGLRPDPHRPEADRRDPRRVVQPLHVDRTVGRRRGQLLDGRARAFPETASRSSRRRS